MESYQEVFLKNKVSGELLVELTEDELKQDLGMKLGDRKRFLRAVAILQNLHKPRKEKRVLKHFKQPYKRSPSMTATSGSPRPTSIPKAPKSIHRFV